MTDRYILRITAGSSYDPATHQVVAVNSATPLTINSKLLEARLNVRIQNYTGLPHASPRTSPYFDEPPHDYNKDQYGITFSFTPKHSFGGNDLVFGNDLDHPVRDRLPPGLNTAFRFAKWFIDPGLEADFYADEPWLYSPLAAGINRFYVRGGDGKQQAEETADKGSGSEDDEEEEEEEEESQGALRIDESLGMWVEEGGDEAGMALRREHGVPDTDAARKKHFLDETKREDWTWKSGIEYGCDFFNPYLDFSEFALRLPGITLHMMSYWDGQPLRYVLKDRSTNTALLVIVFTLFLKDDTDDDGNVKKGVVPGQLITEMGQDRQEMHEHATRDLKGGSVDSHEEELGEATKVAEVKTDAKKQAPGGWDDDEVD